MHNGALPDLAIHIDVIERELGDALKLIGFVQWLSSSGSRLGTGPSDAESGAEAEAAARLDVQAHVKGMILDTARAVGGEAR